MVALVGLATAYQHLGQTEHALTSGLQAAAMAGQSDLGPLEGQARAVIAQVQLAAGRPEQAAEAADQAPAILQGPGYRNSQDQARKVLDRVRRRVGEVSVAEP